MGGLRGQEVTVQAAEIGDNSAPRTKAGGESGDYIVTPHVVL